MPYGITINGDLRGFYQYTTTGSSSITMDGQTIFFAPYEKGGIQDGIPLKVTDASDGGHTDTLFDTANLQPWFTNAFAYDPQDRLSGKDTVNDDGTSTKTVFDTGTEPWSSETSAFDAYQRLQSQRVVFDGGSQQVKQYDPNNTHPYTELDIDEDATGKPTAVQMKFDGQNSTADFSAVGQVLGSALGRALAPNNQFVQLAAGTVIGAIGQKLAQAFAASLTTNGATFDPATVFANFNVSLAGAGASSVASFLVAELGTALHLDGFGGQLFNASAGGFTGSVASQVATKMAQGASFDLAIGTINFADAAASAAYGVSALFGSFLAHEFVPAQTHEGAVAGQLFGAIGSAAGISAALSGALGTVLGFIVPGLGSLIGTILGTLIGDAFGNVPHPAAVDLLDQAGTLYAATHYQVSASDGGDYSTPDQLAVPALAIINAYLGAVKGAAFDHFKQVTLGYQANPVFYIDGVPGHPAIGEYLYPNAAVQAAALDVLQNTEVIGGDLLMKRAHQNSSSNHPQAPVVDPGSNGDPGATGSNTLASAAEQLAVMSGDLGVAQDYENYLNNREAINALMAANPNSAFTAGWIATFARVNELGLNHVNISDFLGGLVGYLDSVNKAGLGAVAANATVSHGGANDSVITVAIKTSNGVEVPGSLAAFADATTIASDATGQTVQFQFGGNLNAGGFQRLGAGAAAGNGVNDLWFGGDAGQTFSGSGGHDILAGGSGNDIIHGGDGWDFIQGGAGNDQLFGDAGNDILRGGAGNDRLDGGSGFDTAVYGGPVGSYTLVSYNGALGVLTHGTEGSDRLQGIENLQFTDTAIAAGAVAAFDGLAYIASYPDLITAYGLNPQSGFEHYVGSGFAEGRSISFDPLQYIASNADLITAFGLNPLAGEQHYIANGYYEHRQTTSFDPFEYIASNADLITAFGLNPLAGEQHYIANGYYEHRSTTSFDAVEYLASNPDLIAAFGLNPLPGEKHYITNGFNEHRPTASFDAMEYLASNPDLIQAGYTPASAAQQYVSAGYFQHRPTTSFDALEYMASNPGMIAAGWTPAIALQHYVNNGYFEHYPTTTFDAVEYLASNPDLIAAGFTPASALQHYVNHGYFENRPTTTFDALEYIASNPDLIAAGFTPASALQHYVSNGFFEHRPTTSFDALEYIASNPDLIAGHATPAQALQHYVSNGFFEHRPTTSFDVVEYIASNPDLIAGHATPAQALQHYVSNGFFEHRPTTSFDALEYIASNPDLIAGHATPAQALQHYVSNGFFEHRATTSFDAAEYLASNPDLIAAGFTPAAALQHYVGAGYFEHRATTSFDALEYVASNKDLIHTIGLDTTAAEAQYIATGYYQGRALASFDAAQYLANYPDLAAGYGSNNLVAARQHYITNGFDEGRTDNHAPVMTVASADVSASAGQTLQATSLFSATDADNDTLVYELYDNSPAADSGHFAVNGTVVPANTPFAVSAAQLAQTAFVAGAAGASDDLFVWASDNKVVSNMSEFHVNVAANHAPVMTVASADVSASAGQTLQATSLFSATDADNDTLSYGLYDNSPAANSGHFAVNGTVVPANTAFAVSAAQLAQTTFIAGAAGTSDDLFVWASDNKVVSNMSEFHILV